MTLGDDVSSKELLSDGDRVSVWLLEAARFGLYGVVVVGWAGTVDSWTAQALAAALMLAAFLLWNLLHARGHSLVEPATWRFFPVHMALLLAFGALSAPQMWSFYLYFVTASLALFVYGLRWGPLASAAVAAAALLHFAYVTGEGASAFVAGMGTAFLFVIGFTYVALQQATDRDRTAGLLAEVEASRDALAKAHEQLQEQAATAEQLARERERNRLAGEIHDTLAYTLTTLVVQLQAARRLMDTGDAAAAGTTMDESIRLARQGLQEVRRSVRDLRPELLERQSLPVALEEMGRGFGQATGMEVTLHIDGVPQPLSDAVERTVFRCVQEALTNAHRHGQAQSVAIDLQAAGERLDLHVRDDGRSAADASGVTESFGLSTMRERLESLGGSLQITTGPGTGFHLAASLPLHAGAGAAADARVAAADSREVIS